MPDLSRSRNAPNRALRLASAGAFALAAGLTLAACQTMPPESEAEKAAAAAPYPNLSSVPQPPAAMAAEMRRREAERLAADRERAQSADQALRPQPGAAANAETTSWGRRVGAVSPAGSPPRVAPNQRATLAEVARLVRGRAGRVRLVHAAETNSDAAAKAVATELGILGVASARIVYQPVRRRAPVPGAAPEPAPPPNGEVQIYVD